MLVNNGFCAGQPPRFFLPVRLWNQLSFGKEILELGTVNDI